MNFEEAYALLSETAELGLTSGPAIELLHWILENQRALRGNPPNRPNERYRRVAALAHYYTVLNKKIDGGMSKAFADGFAAESACERFKVAPDTFNLWLGEGRNTNSRTVPEATRRPWT